MKKLFSSAALAAVLSLSALAIQAAEVARAAYHIDYAAPDRYSLSLTSVNNMLNAYGQELRGYDVQTVSKARPT